MDILKAATDWAKAELVSTPFFILFGVVFMASSYGFWQFGKTEIAKAYVLPTLIAGILLAIIGLGLFYTNKGRLTQFEKEYKADSTTFVNSEIVRAEATLKEYKNIVFTIIPIIMICCCLVIIFINTPIVRASVITTIAMLVVILLIDGTAHSRINEYYKQLQTVKINK